MNFRHFSILVLALIFLAACGQPREVKSRPLAAAQVTIVTRIVTQPCTCATPSPTTTPTPSLTPTQTITPNATWTAWRATDNAQIQTMIASLFPSPTIELADNLTAERRTGTPTRVPTLRPTATPTQQTNTVVATNVTSVNRLIRQCSQPTTNYQACIVVGSVAPGKTKLLVAGSEFYIAGFKWMRVANVATNQWLAVASVNAQQQPIAHFMLVK